MLFSTIGQSRVFLLMTYAGLLIGLYLNADQALRRLFGAGRALSFFMDLFAGLTISAVILCALLLTAGGELRLYALMGALCGYLIWTATLGPLLNRLLRLIISPPRALFRWLRKRTFLQKFFR